MLTRIALDACPHCINGCASHPNAAGHRCDTAGCALEGYPVPYNGLAERQQVLWPKELLAFVDIARQSVEDCGCGLPKPANVDTLKTYIIEDEAGASEMCRSCLAFLRALSAWDAVLESPEIYPGRESLPAAGSPPASTTPPAPDVHAGGGAPTLTMQPCSFCGEVVAWDTGVVVCDDCARKAGGLCRRCLHSASNHGHGPVEDWSCRWPDCGCKSFVLPVEIRKRALPQADGHAELLPDYVKPLRALSRDVLGRDALEKP